MFSYETSSWRRNKRTLVTTIQLTVVINASGKNECCFQNLSHLCVHVASEGNVQNQRKNVYCKQEKERTQHTAPVALNPF
jgi:hypothetical protein